MPKEVFLSIRTTQEISDHVEMILAKLQAIRPDLNRNQLIEILIECAYDKVILGKDENGTIELSNN